MGGGGGVGCGVCARGRREKKSTHPEASTVKGTTTMRTMARTLSCVFFGFGVGAGVLVVDTGRGAGVVVVDTGRGGGVVVVLFVDMGRVVVAVVVAGAAVRAVRRTLPVSCVLDWASATRSAESAGEGEALERSMSNAVTIADSVVSVSSIRAVCSRRRCAGALGPARTTHMRMSAADVLVARIKALRTLNSCSVSTYPLSSWKLYETRLLFCVICGGCVTRVSVWPPRGTGGGARLPM